MSASRIVSWLPWARRMPPLPEARPFDSRGELKRLAPAALRNAAELLSGSPSPSASRQRVQAYCEALIGASEHLKLAWAWFGPRDADQLEPQVIAGPAAGYAQSLSIRRTWLTSLGPAFRALDGRPATPFNVNSASLYEPWREVAEKHGVRSVLALPLATAQDTRRGLFVLYADVPDYFDAVGVGLFEGAGELIASVLSHVQRQRRLERRARTDPLTGLANRAHAQATMRALLGEVGLAPVSLLLVDLDHFKRVNDELGHAVGDAVLRASARCLRDGLRRDDGVARWGGEEFVVWLPKTALSSALVIAEKLRLGLAHARHEQLAADAVVTGSIGVLEVAAGESVEAALERADAALYTAKREGRNRVRAARSADATAAGAGQGGGDQRRLVERA